MAYCSNDFCAKALPCPDHKAEVLDSQLKKFTRKDQPPLGPGGPAAWSVELEELKKATGWKEPVRSFIDEDMETSNLRTGKRPDYTGANLAFLKGKSRNHKEGSLEMVVENLVKTWEFERSHKLDAATHQSVDQERFSLSANGWKKYGNVEANKVGNYNVLLHGADKEQYDAATTTHKESHDLFHGAYETFPWEVLEVFSGPPRVAFTWRHWAHFTGTYKGVQGKGQLLELFGWGTAEVNDKLQLCECEMYFDHQKFLAVMEGKVDAKELALDAHTKPVCPLFNTL